MAKNQTWHDDYWLLVMQLYLSEPAGVKPLYSRPLVDLSLELHLPPRLLHQRLSEIASLETPRIERIWQEYSRDPERLTRAVQLLRGMTGFNSGGGFYEGVEVEETFERDFRPLPEDKRFTPVMLTLILDLYFRLTPATMVGQTPEVRELAHLMGIPAKRVVEVLGLFQHCDPCLSRRGTPDSPLLGACRQLWRRYGNDDPRQLAAYASQLKEYFRNG